MTTWAEIAVRCQDASGEDRGLDWATEYALGAIPAHSLREIGFDYDWCRKPGEMALWKANDSEGRNMSLWQPRPLSASVDAVLGLVAEKLKGVQVDLAIREDGTAAATIDVGARIEDLDSDPWKDGRGATPALALLAAFALAMQAEEGVNTVKEGAEG